MVNANDTREKILTVASELFGRQGFNGVSIRDIAQEADVNVAAVNYHFKNKSNLFHEVFLASHFWLEQEIKQISTQENISISDLTWQTFCLFLDNGSMLLNTFRVFLSDQLDVSQEDKNDHGIDAPPGSDIFIEVLTRELGNSITDDTKEFIVRSLFCQLFHMGMVVNLVATNKSHCMHQPWMERKQLEKDIREIVDIFTSHYQSKP